MYKIGKSIIIFFFLIVFTSPSNSHVQHYENTNRIEFDIYRNNKQIGKHIFSFEKSDDEMLVKSDIKFEIRKFGIVLYKYRAQGTELFKDGKLVKFNSKTNQNGKDKYVNLHLEGEEFVIDGSSFKGKVPADYLLGTWWNHSIIKSKAQISAVSGRIIEQNVEFIGKEKIKINNKYYNTLHFQFTSTDTKLSKNKRLNTHVWYDEKNLNWVKAAFDKKGKWEYKLVSIK